MKNFKRVLAIVTVISIVAMSSMISTFALGTFDAKTTADAVKAGEVVTIAVEMSSLDGAKGTTASVKFDNTAFTLPEGDNTAYNFGNAMKKSYYPNYINNAFTARAYDAIKNGGMDLPLTLWQTVSYNATENEALLVLVDAAAGTVITSEYEEMIAGPYNVGHFDFIANDDIAPGSYDFEVKLDVSTESGLQTFTETITVTVAGAEPPVKYEEKTISEKATVDTNDITIGEDVYTNVAVFDAAIDVPEASELEEGEAVLKTGVKFGNLTKEFDIIGDVTYKILCYGITADQANALDVAAYYVANLVKAN